MWERRRRDDWSQERVGQSSVGLWTLRGFSEGQGWLPERPREVRKSWEWLDPQGAEPGWLTGALQILSHLVSPAAFQRAPCFSS